MENRYIFLALAIMLSAALIAGCMPQQPAGDNSQVVVPGLTADISDMPGQTEPEPQVEVTTDTTGGYFAKITVNEGELIKLDLEAADPDGDLLRYTFSSPLNAAGEWQTKMGDAGEYPATITASDGKLETSKKILIVVKAINQAPKIEPVKDITIVEGQKLVLNLKASDQNNDILVWKYDTPIGLDGTWQTKVGDAGDYPIKATVSDGYLSDSVSFNVRVVKLNHPPTLDIAREMTVNEGDTIKLNPKVSDVDGDSVVVSYSGWMTGDTYMTSFSDAGRHEVEVIVSDGTAATTATVWITVNNVNRAPTINGLIVK